MSKWLEVIGIIAAAGAVTYLVIENNPSIKKSISNIITHGPIPISITPPSSQEQIVYHGTPPPGVTPKGVCKPGEYLDQTDGIFTCVDPHGIRQLNPNVKQQHIQNLNPNPRIAYPDYGIAYGIRYIDNDYWGYSGKPDLGFASQQQQQQQQQPNMTQPLVQPDINKEIESQIKKGHQKEVKHQKNLDDKRLIREHGNVVAAQVECPKDLKDVPCGGHCYKNGHLMAVDCSGQRNKDKDKDKIKKKPSSLVIPPNFPSQIIVTPGEEPYPEDQMTTEGGGGGGGGDQTPITGTTPGGSIPSLELTPGQQPIVPTIPPTAPTIAPTPSTPPQKVQIPSGNVFYPFTPWKDKRADSNGCATISYHSGGSGRSCRWQADDKLMRSKIGNNGYRIDVTLDLGDIAEKKNQEISITSGGPGSSKGLCCGFTTRININDGTLQLESEDWSEGGTTGATYCKGVSCVEKGPTSISAGQPLYNTKGIQLAWIVIRNGNHATYHAEATGPAGTVISKSFTDPHAHKNGGPPIIPFHAISGSVGNDPHRVRVDSCKSVIFHTPSVTVLPAATTTSGFYNGPEGYIDPNDPLLGMW